MSALKWHMDAKRRKRSLSVLDEQENQKRDAASKWIEKHSRRPQKRKGRKR